MKGAYKEEGVGDGRDQSSYGRVRQAQQSKKGTSVVKQGVVTGELAEHLDETDTEDGSSIRLVSPELDHSFFEGCCSLKNGSGVHVCLDDVELEFDDLG
jgi:hypothetical protein